MNLLRTLLAATVATLVVAPAVNAQDVPVTLNVNGGNVMTSNGAGFAAAATGAALAPGHRIMVGEGANAELVYGNGCRQRLESPGVYGVPAQCVASAGQAGGSSGSAAVAAAGTDWTAALIIGGVAVAGAAGLASMDDGDDNPSPPVSR